jgi:glycosyltransferase involved in cell wall biosynthesis
VHSCLWGAVIAHRLKIKFNIPYIITEHRGRFNENNYTKSTDIKKWFIKLLKQPLLKANAIIPVSHLQIKSLEEISGNKLNCFPIPNPVDEIIFKPVSGRIENQHVSNFYTVTNFLPYKAPEILIHSFHEALIQENNIFLFLIGDGPDRNRIEDLCNKLNIQDNVHFLGRVSNTKMPTIISPFDFLVLSSLNEGQPVVVGESMLCGKPVIGTNIISDIDIPDFAGYIVPVGDKEALTLTLLKAHREKTKFNAVKIRDFALKRFARSAVIPAIIQVMKTATTNQKGIN